MLPIDDPSWPNCDAAGCPNLNGAGTGWCEHVREDFIGNLDAVSFRPGMNYCVPIVPVENLYAEVNLGTDEISTDPAMVELSLVPPDDPFGTADLIPIGLHVHGEGRIEIGYNLIAWMEGQPGLDKCVYHRHSYKQEMGFQKIIREGDPTKLKANSWCLAYYKKCFPCLLEEQVNTQSVTVAPAFNAGQFGLDHTVRDTSGPTNAHQATTMDLLKKRFGN